MRRQKSVRAPRWLAGATSVAETGIGPVDRRYFDPASAEFRQDALEQNGRSLRLKATCQF